MSSHSLRTSALLASAAIVAVLAGGCSPPPSKTATPFVFLANCSGRIDKLDLNRNQIVKSVRLQDVAKDIPQGRGVSGCQLEHAAYDPARNELVAISPRDPGPEDQRLQIVRLSGETLELAGPPMLREEKLPAHILLQGDRIWLGLGQAGDPEGRIVQLDRSGAVQGSWAGSGFESDARFAASPSVIYSRFRRIELKYGRAESTAAIVAFGGAFADSVGETVLLLKPPEAIAIWLKEQNPKRGAIAVSANQPIAGLHLLKQGAAVAVEAEGRVAEFDLATGKRLWDAPLPEKSRFVCAVSETLVYTAGSQLTIVRPAAATAAIPLPQPLDPGAFCITTDRN